jgi:hypothetical protein
MFVRKSDLERKIRKAYVEDCLVQIISVTAQEKKDGRDHHAKQIVKLETITNLCVRGKVMHKSYARSA